MAGSSDPGGGEDDCCGTRDQGCGDEGTERWHAGCSYMLEYPISIPGILIHDGTLPGGDWFPTCGTYRWCEIIDVAFARVPCIRSPPMGLSC